MADLQPGAVLTATVEKAVAGGEMLARHEGQVVLVTGAIPGERVRVRIRRVAARTVHALTEEVLVAAADRRPAGPDAAGCAGQVYGHIAYARQLALKAEVVRDAWTRVARLPWPDDATWATVESPEHGFRMRARLHGDGQRIGFLRDGTHELCAASAGGQLLGETVLWLDGLASRGAAAGLGITSVELTESVAGTTRACHLRGRREPSPAWMEAAGAGSTALSWSPAGTRPADTRRGRRSSRPEPDDRGPAGASLVDVVHPRPGGPPLSLRRHARGFFQGNRFLLDPLLQHVVHAAGEGPVLDLYAGVGLFGLSCAAAGAGAVVAVEGDAIGGADLAENARSLGPGVQVVREPVEQYLGRRAAARFAPSTVVLDPPRTGMGPAVAARTAGLGARRIIFVSCDPATFARDGRALLDGGYALTGVTLFDLFPNTAHVEAVAFFDRV